MSMRGSRTWSGAPAIMGVLKIPGAIVQIRTPWRDRSRAIGKCHAGNTSLAGGIGGLAYLTIERCNRGRVDDNTSSSASPSGSLTCMIAAHLLRTENVPIRFTCTMKLNLAISRAPSRPTVRDVRQCPHNSLMCIAPKSSAIWLIALLTDSSSVTFT